MSAINSGAQRAEAFAPQIKRKKTFWRRLVEQRQLLVLIVPFLCLILVFNYVPLAGWLMALRGAMG